MKVTVPHPDQPRDTDLIFFFFKVEQRAMIEFGLLNGYMKQRAA